MNYRIEILRPARKFIERQPAAQRKRILCAMMALPAGDVRRLHGGDALYRLRVGDFRILFTRDEATATIAVINIGNRGDVYK